MVRGSKEERWGGLREWLTGSFRLDGRSIQRGREEVHLCHHDVWLLCDCSADYVQGRGKRKGKCSACVCVCRRRCAYVHVCEQSCHVLH